MKEIFIERQNDLLRIAVKDKDRLTECYMEEEDKEPYPGEIYRGIVKNIVPAIKCAFIDIGNEKNCYLYMDKRMELSDIKKGRELLVQVLKEGTQSKGAKVTTALEIPGRYCVLLAGNKEVDFSRKITNEEFKEDIKKNIVKPDDVGIMIRTNAEKAGTSAICTEIEMLYKMYNSILNEFKYGKKQGKIHSSGGILAKILRDKLDQRVSKVITDNEKDFEFADEFMKNIEIDIPVVFHNDERALFDSYGIEKEILSLRNNKVVLPCGGFIIIEKTEAMYVIDVNSGKNVKSMSIDRTAFFTNMEAAVEGARQIKLRNLAGIIVIDFIDMDDPVNRDKVLQKLREEFAEDKNKTIIYPFTELNLVQIGRRRVGKPIYDFLEEDCKECRGNGKRLRFSYIKLLIRNEIIRISNQNGIKDIHIEVDGYYEQKIRAQVLGFIEDIGASNKTIYITFTERQEYYKVEPLIFANQVQIMQPYRIYG